jgi:hypothetical protein
MAPVTDERAIRAALSDLTSKQPPAGDRLEAVRDRLTRQRRRRIAISAASALAVVLVLAVVSQLPGVLGGQPRRHQTPATSVTSPAGSSASPSATAASPTAPAVSRTPAQSGTPVNLVASASVKAALVAAFVRYKGIPAQDVVGTEGSVDYAYAPSTHLYWALTHFTPSRSAPLKVQVSFQDGANFVILVRPAGSNWSVVNFLGEPPCALNAGLPPAIERTWSLNESFCGRRLSQAVSIDDAAGYRASFDVPASWRSTPYQGGEAFDRDGSNGFVSVDASAGPSTIRAACQQIATINALHPYGTTPTLTVTTIDNHPACLISPSADAAPEAMRAGGPEFADSAVIVRYRVLLSNSFRYLLITCDPSHLWSIAESIQLAPGY